MAVLLVEHDIDRVFAFADRITVMNEGAVLVDGGPEEIRRHPEVQRVYLGGERKAFIEAVERREAAPGETILTLNGVNTYYGKSHILHDVALELRAGEAVALLGRNGAGKSSTIKSIMGLVAPRSGEIRFQGQAIAGRTPEQIARLGIGLVPQGRACSAASRSTRTSGWGPAPADGAGVHWERERIFPFFPRVQERLHSKADVLSGGERQMVAIARALGGNVRLLLLDEPFEGLAPTVVEEIFHALHQLRREVPLLIIEHDLDLVLALADRAYVLDRGRITHEGPAEPLHRPRVPKGGPLAVRRPRPRGHVLWRSNRAVGRPGVPGSEDQHLADRPARGQAVEGLVQLVQADPLAQQPVDRQAPLPVQLDVARHVADRHAAADVAALERALLADQGDLGQREAVVGVRQARRHRGAAAPGHLPGEFHRLDRPGHLEGEVDPARGRVAHRLGAVRIAGIEGVGRAELAGERQLVLDEIEGDDPPGAGEPRAEHRVQADPAEADDRDRLAGHHAARC